MKTVTLIKRTFDKIKREGLGKTSRAMFSHLYDLYFDRKYKIDTSSWSPREDFLKENKIPDDFGHYQPNYVYLIKKVLKRLNLPKNQNFIDLGSGKGRVLLIAAQYGFEVVRGVEFSKPLCEIAQRNVVIFKTKVLKLSPIQIDHMDARDYIFSENDSVIFMYNPFNGYVFETVIKNLKASIERYPRTVTLIYMHPTEKKCIESILPITTKRAYTWNEDYIIYTID